MTKTVLEEMLGITDFNKAERTLRAQQFQTQVLDKVDERTKMITGGLIRFNPENLSDWLKARAIDQFKENELTLKDFVDEHYDEYYKTKADFYYLGLDWSLPYNFTECNDIPHGSWQVTRALIRMRTGFGDPEVTPECWKQNRFWTLGMKGEVAKALLSTFSASDMAKTYVQLRMGDDMPLNFEQEYGHNYAWEEFHDGRRIE